MTPKIEEHHFQDITPILAEKLSNADIDDLMYRFNFSGVGDRGGYKKESRLNYFFRNLRPPDKRATVLSYLVDRVSLSGAEQRQVHDALSGSGYWLFEDMDGNTRLVVRTTPAAEEEAVSHQNYLEDYASEDVLTHLTNAKSHLAKNEYEATCDELRRAFESMTTTGYMSGLKELEENGLIEEDPAEDGHHTFDLEMLYGPYSYAGNVGSHTDADYGGPSQLQATTAVILTEEAIHFVLRKLEEASNMGLTLEKWDIST